MVFSLFGKWLKDEQPRHQQQLYGAQTVCEWLRPSHRAGVLWPCTELHSWAEVRIMGNGQSKRKKQAVRTAPIWGEAGLKVGGSWKTQCFTSSLKAEKKKKEVWEQRQLSKDPHRMVSLFVLFRLSTDWTRPAYTGKSICFTRSTDTNANLTQNHPHRHIRIMFDLISGRLWLDKLTYEMNHLHATGSVISTDNPWFQPFLMHTDHSDPQLCSPRVVYTTPEHCSTFLQCFSHSPSPLHQEWAPHP